jgi:hypothetical protein
MLIGKKNGISYDAQRGCSRLTDFLEKEIIPVEEEVPVV